MTGLKWIFPTGSILTIGGVLIGAVLDRLENTQGLEFAILENIYLPVLLLGSVLAIVGSFFDRTRLTVKKAKARGLVCWLVSAVSFLLFYTIGNVHGWTFAFLFPAVVGFITGAVLLYW